jgi:hypothetical protein
MDDTKGKVFIMIFPPQIDRRALWWQAHESAVSFHKSLSQDSELLVQSGDSKVGGGESRGPHGLRHSSVSFYVRSVAPESNLFIICRHFLQGERSARITSYRGLSLSSVSELLNGFRLNLVLACKNCRPHLFLSVSIQYNIWFTRDSNLNL